MMFSMTNQGIPIEMYCVGASRGRYGNEFKRLLETLDPRNHYLKCSGHAPFESMHRFY